MSAKLDSVLAAAMELSEEDRLELADRLFFTLSPDRQAAVDRSWAEEAERRLSAYRQGKLESVPYEDAMRSIRERLKK